MTAQRLPIVIREPAGRSVHFTELTWQHIQHRRAELLDELPLIVAAVESPDYHELDPIEGRERYYRRRLTDKVRWLNVVVDFSVEPATVVTAFIQRKNPVQNQ